MKIRSGAVSGAKAAASPCTHSTAVALRSSRGFNPTKKRPVFNVLPLPLMFPAIIEFLEEKVLEPEKWSFHTPAPAKPSERLFVMVA